MNNLQDLPGRKPGLSTLKYGVGIVLLLAILCGAWSFLPGHGPKPPPPLPFSTNGLIATVDPMAHAFDLPPNPTVGDRLGHLVFRLSGGNAHAGSSTSTFPTNAVTGCSIQGLLNQCMGVNGTRYLMPLGVAAGVVQFGNSNVLDGEHWVAAFESALQSDGVQCWDEKTSRTGPEHLVLLRFPTQNVVVVLPAGAAVEFERTNGINADGGKVIK